MESNIIKLDLCKLIGLEDKTLIYKGNGYFRYKDTNVIALNIYSEHDYQCCEGHYLSFIDEDIPKKNSEFNPKKFKIEKIEGFGIALIPTNGHKIRIPGYGDNNGYYSSNLSLVLENAMNKDKIYEIDIEECQDY